MRVQVNPDNRPNGQPLVVRHPATGKPFPQKPFDLSEAELINPGILRLLPSSIPGGQFGDLVPVEDVPPKATGDGGSAKSK